MTSTSLLIMVGNWRQPGGPLLGKGQKNMMDSNHGIVEGHGKQQAKCKCNLNSS